MRTHAALSRVNRGIARSCAVLVLLALTGCRAGDALRPNVGVLLGEMNGSAISLPASARVLHRAGMPDSLMVIARNSDIMVQLAVEYTGPGTYSIGPEQFELLLLVGGDGITGSYRGSAPTTGQLLVTEASGRGSPLRAELWFDATHENGESRLGPSIQFRSGRLTATLQ